MSNQKFNKGDKVRINADQCIGHGFLEGAVATIGECRSKPGTYGNMYVLTVKGVRYCQVLAERQLDSVVDLMRPVFTTEGTPVDIVTRRGRDAKFPVLAYEGKAKQLSKYSLYGVSKTGVKRRNLTNVQAQPQPEREVFVNVFEGCSQIFGAIEHATPEAAVKSWEDFQYKPAGVKRVGVVKLVQGRLPNLEG
jgi:hypothetical protein